MIEIGFIILHYKTLQESRNCIDSILGLTKVNVDTKVIVVDNFSGDNSGEILKKEYKEYDNIEFILLEQNVGFSKGNNIAYRKLVEYGQYDFIIVCNNDISFPQTNFLDVMINSYNRNPFYVCGPDVFAVYKQVHQNPIAKTPKTYNEAIEVRTQVKKIWKTRYIDYIKQCIKNILPDSIVQIIHPYKNSPTWEQEQKDVVLSGACLIFSQKYISTNRDLFWPETFFYYEEDILFHRCLINGWNVLYDPNLKVNHFEGRSTNAEAQGFIKKRKFYCENYLKSINIYINMLEEENKNGI